MWFLLQQCWPSLAALVGQQALLSGQKQIAIKYCTKLWKTDLVLKEKQQQKKLTFLHSADFLYILLELYANLTDYTTVLLAHLSSQERAFGGHHLSWRWHRVASWQLGLHLLFGGCKGTKVLNFTFTSNSIIT